MKLKDLIAPFYVWKRAFEKPYTVSKPLKRAGADRYRGFHFNDVHECVGCGSCSKICQNEAIDMVKVDEPKRGDSGLRPRVDYGRCCYCALCVDICPTSSLRMSNEYLWIDSDPEVYRFIPGVDKKPWDNPETGYRRADHYHLLAPARREMEMHHFDGKPDSFIELVKGYSFQQAVEEADRCIECGLCVSSCPGNMDIPAYVKAIRDNNLEDAVKILYESNPFPAACGRVCTHRCEDVCALGHTGDPIAIRWLKRYIIDQFELDQYNKEVVKVEKELDKKIAIIGAGPGGLTCAYYLRKMGYKVTVFESHSHGGGMLRFGIPEYRLPYDQLDKDIDLIVNMGVELKTSCAVGKDIEFTKIYDDFDAVFLSTGLPEAYGLQIEGEDHARVISGVALLEDITNGITPDLGKRVAVIGGGNVAMDAARTAARLGSEVTVLYRRREEDMPADDEEIYEAKEEKVNLVTQAIPIKIAEVKKDVLGLTWGKAKMVDQGPDKRPKPVLQEDQTQVDEFDTVITAIGQGADFSFIPESFNEKLNISNYKIALNDKNQAADPKVFAGGDVANRVRDAISAIADGHHAAICIDEWLLGK